MSLPFMKSDICLVPALMENPEFSTDIGIHSESPTQDVILTL